MNKDKPYVRERLSLFTSTTEKRNDLLNENTFPINRVETIDIKVKLFKRCLKLLCVKVLRNIL